MNPVHEGVTPLASAPEGRGDVHVVPAILPTADRVGRVRVLQAAVRSAVAPYLSRQVQRVGRTGVGGAGLLMAALAFFVGTNVPLRHQVVTLQQELEAAKQARLESAANARPAPDTDARLFLERLPARGQLPQMTETILAQASASGIALERGTYDFSVMPSRRVVRARMTFPVHGKYPDIRRFVDGTLAALPSAAVDGLRLERKDIGATEIDAQVRFAVYLREAP